MDYNVYRTEEDFEADDYEFDNCEFAEDGSCGHESGCGCTVGDQVDCKHAEELAGK